MSIFNIDSQNFYMIGAHGCSPSKLHSSEDTEEFSQARFFTVPDNFMIVYLTSNGVQSEGSKNISFIKNLYDYNRELFNYIFNPMNYEINLDKTNPSSYRHPDFFKSLPLFSNFNYLCNFELYPPGVPCPFIHLSFSKECEISSKCYYEGITPLENIISPKRYGEKLGFNNPLNIYNPLDDLIDTTGFAYTYEIFQNAVKKFSLRGGVFFISACRAEYFVNRGVYKIVDIHPITRNCGNITYDLEFIDNLIKQYPESRSSLETVRTRLVIRDRRKNDIDRIILTNYAQNRIYLNSNPIHIFYNFITKVGGEINICVNFTKILINCNLTDPTNMTLSLLKLIEYKFYEIRIRLKNRDVAISECVNNMLYEKYGYILRFVFGYINTYRAIPNEEIFTFFWNFIDINYSDNKERMIAIINEYFKPLYNFIISGGTNMNNLNYKNKYLKYKIKYLNLVKKK